MAVNTIQLTRYDQFASFVNGRDNCRTRIVAENATGVDNEIFLHENTDQGDEFIGVATVEDLAEYAADAPNLGQDPAYFRKDIIDVILRNPDDVDELWLVVLNDVNSLLYTLENGSILAGEELINLP